MYDLIIFLIKNRTNRTNPNRISLVWFGLDLFFKSNRTKPNCMFFSLAVRMIFCFKIAQTTPRTPLAQASLMAAEISQKNKTSMSVVSTIYQLWTAPKSVISQRPNGHVAQVKVLKVS